VAFPAVSAGAYGWPAHDAARIAVAAVAGAAAGVAEVRFVLFTEEMHATFDQALRSLADP
jgi:O-acetyl-ADP-ribose deacetylase (regulator of RNase III)